MSIKIRTILLYISLFISGFCGISYEVLYARILSNIIGDHFIAGSSVFLSFLLGISIGTRWAYLFRSYLWLFESAIGIYALIFAYVYPFLNSISIIKITHQNIFFTVLISLAILIIPSICIGISIPLFSDLFKRNSKSKVFPRVYAIYNLAAFVTALAIEFYIIRQIGIKDTMILMSSLNLLIGIFIFSCQEQNQTYQTEIDNEATIIPRVIVTLFIFSALSSIFQLLTYKISNAVLGPFHETFAITLSIMLLGISVGAFVVQILRISLNKLLLINAIYFIVVIFLFDYYLQIISQLNQNWPSSFILKKIFIIGIIAFIPAACFGASIPAALNEGKNIAKNSGYLLFITSLANVFGYLIMVFILHPYASCGQTMLILSITIILLWLYIKGPAKLINQAITIAIIIIAIITYTKHWKEDYLYLDYLAFKNPTTLNIEMTQFESFEAYKKNNETFSINISNGKKFFFINGYTSMQFGTFAEYAVGILSAIVTKNLDQALVLGLGSGSTAGTISELFNKVDVVEISQSIVDQQHLMSGYNFNIKNKSNVQISVADGIQHVKSTNKKYNLILNTVTSPLYFSSSKLYTHDFFKNIKKALSDSGVYTTWLDLRMGDEGVKIILQTLKQNFNHCAVAALRSQYYLLACSNEKITQYHSTTVLNNNTLKNFVEMNHGKEIDSYRYAYLLDDAYKCINTQTLDGKMINTIDFPILEFTMTRQIERGIKNFRDCVIKNHLQMKNKESFYGVNAINKYKYISYFAYPSWSSTLSKKLRNEIGKTDNQFRAKFIDYTQSRLKSIAIKYNNTPDHWINYLDWINKFKSRKEYNSAIEEVSTLIPEEPKIIYYKAKNLYSNKSYMQSIQLLESIHDVNSNLSNKLHFLIAKNYYKLKKFNEAIIALGKIKNLTKAQVTLKNKIISKM